MPGHLASLQGPAASRSILPSKQFCCTLKLPLKRSSPGSGQWTTWNSRQAVRLRCVRDRGAPVPYRALAGTQGSVGPGRDGPRLMDPCEYLETIDEYLKMEEALKSGEKRRLSPAEQWGVIKSEDGKGEMFKMKEDWREYVTFKDVLKQVREGRNYHGEPLRNKLGWLCHVAEDYDYFKCLDYGADEVEASMRWDYEQCQDVCKVLGLDFRKVKEHLEWAAGYARGIDRGACLFCYGAANAFEWNDLDNAVLRVTSKESPAPGGQASLLSRRLVLVKQGCQTFETFFTTASNFHVNRRRRQA